MAFRRTIAINENPRIELALREIETAINSMGGTSIVVSDTNETIVTTSANHTQGAESAVYVNTDLGARVVYLKPDAKKGDKYKVGNRGSNQLTVDGVGRNINGSSTLVLAYENSTAQLQFNGTKWMII